MIEKDSTEVFAGELGPLSRISKDRKMKFGKEFKKLKVPEWTDAYMDYNGLKRILREIMLHKLSNRPPLVAQQKITLHRNFSGLHIRSHSIGSTGDIEDQVIDVNTLPRDGSRQYYKTNFLRQSEEGGEIEVMFFRKLDEELNKVNSFYKDKVRVVMCEAAELNKQMDALLALRVTVERKYCSTASASTVPLGSSSSSSSGDGSVGGGTRDTVGPRFEMSNLSPLEEDPDSQSGKHAGNDLSDSCQEEEFTATPDVGPVPISDYASDSRHDKKIISFREDPLEILERVKINNTLETPISTIKGLLRDSKDDELRLTKKELRKVEERLRVVFIEFFQKLLILKHYSFMNLTAFSKIMKKYDKITSRRASRSYMKVVDDSYLGSSDEVNILLERVEATFIKHFANSNRKEGMKLLRPKAKKEKHSTTFLFGFFSGCSVALIVAVVLRIEGINFLEKQEGASYMVNIFPLYSLFLFAALHMFMYAANIYFWRRFRVNYPFIFGFKPGTEMGYREVLLVSIGLGVLALASFLANLQLSMGSRTKHYRKLSQLVPLFSIAVVIAVMLCPFDIIYRANRFFFIKSLFHSLCAPLYKVTLPDFFLADNLTSQVQAIRSIELYICYYSSGELSENRSKCHSHRVYNAFYFIVAIIPYWLRFLQCVRRLCEEKETVHGYNGLKYLIIIVAVVLRTAYELKKGTNYLMLALISSAAATAMSTYWDIVMDWGLLRRKSKNPYLRDKLVVSSRSVYFAVMVINVVLRVAWMQLVLEFNLHALHKMALTTSISCLEIIRRGMWSFFRLENEHLNNVGRYRAFKSVPLPFNYYDDETDKDD